MINTRRMERGRGRFKEDIMRGVVLYWLETAGSGKVLLRCKEGVKGGMESGG